MTDVLNYKFGHVDKFGTVADFALLQILKRHTSLATQIHQLIFAIICQRQKSFIYF